MLSKIYMSHIDHITKNKKLLQVRADIIRDIRKFFWNKGFREVETPLLLRLPGQEPYLSPIKLSALDDRGITHDGYLHTSPEYTMKKMLASGFENIFSICKTFRNKESFGGTHNTEFTMIEWYRVGKTMYQLMDDIENLFAFLIERLDDEYSTLSNIQFQRISMKELWQNTIDIDLDYYLTQPSIYGLCRKKKYNVKKDESYEDLFYRIFLNEIEPKFHVLNSALIIYNYPAPMAALAKLSNTKIGYAERFEVYVNNMEIANAFTELTDRDEQLRRLQEEQELRRKMKKDIYDIDMNFVEAVGKMPECAGIALGVDRLIQVLLKIENIDDILVLPMSKIF